MQVNGLVNVLVNDDVSLLASDVSGWRGSDDVMQGWRQQVNTWRVEARDGAWSAWAFAQNLLAARNGAWDLRWWSSFNERVDRQRTILVVLAKTQSEQRSQWQRYGSGLETLNNGGYRSGTRDDDWNASEV